jgi:uncharacterized Zn finger protein
VTIRVPLGTGTGVLTDALNRDLLASQAGWLIFERGFDYEARGLVTGLEATETRATATVVGTRPYEVSIELDAAEVAFDCSCPMGKEDRFCKHLVALGLMALGDVDDGFENRVGAARSDDLAVVRAWLDEQPEERLRDLLIDQAVRDPELHRLLSVLAAAEEGAPIDLAAYRAAVAGALAIGNFDDYGYVHYRDAWAWRQGVEAVIDDLEGLLKCRVRRRDRRSG